MLQPGDQYGFDPQTQKAAQASINNVDLRSSVVINPSQNKIMAGMHPPRNKLLSDPPQNVGSLAKDNRHDQDLYGLPKQGGGLDSSPLGYQKSGKLAGYTGPGHHPRTRATVLDAQGAGLAKLNQKHHRHVANDAMTQSDMFL